MKARYFIFQLLLLVLLVASLLDSKKWRTTAVKAAQERDEALTVAEAMYKNCTNAQAIALEAQAAARQAQSIAYELLKK